MLNYVKQIRPPVVWKHQRGKIRICPYLDQDFLDNATWSEDFPLRSPKGSDDIISCGNDVTFGKRGFFFWLFAFL